MALDSAIEKEVPLRYVKPVPKDAPVGSPYGPRNDPMSPRSTRDHWGVDFRVPEGTEVTAIAEGTVERASYHGDFGNTVVIDHGNGRYSVYGHLKDTDVTPGPGTKLAPETGSEQAAARGRGAPVRTYTWECST